MYVFWCSVYKYCFPHSFSDTLTIVYVNAIDFCMLFLCPVILLKALKVY